MSAGLEAVKKATAAAETVAPIILFNPRLARSVVAEKSSRLAMPGAEIIFICALVQTFNLASICAL